MKELLKFEAPWCTHCNSLGALMDKSNIDLSQIKVRNVNVDTEKDLAAKYFLRAIPCLILIDENGVEQRRLQGMPTAEKLKLFLED